MERRLMVMIKIPKMAKRRMEMGPRKALRRRMARTTVKQTGTVPNTVQSTTSSHKTTTKKKIKKVRRKKARRRRVNRPKILEILKMEKIRKAKAKKEKGRSNKKPLTTECSCASGGWVT